MTKDDPKSECSICLDWFKNGKENRITELNCSDRHFFHEDCLKKWIIHNDICPLCREKILPKVS